MKKIFLLLAVHSLFSYAQTTVVNTSFFSSALNTQRNVQIILPPGYDPGGTTKYPVIYFLHGVLNNQSGYPEVNTVLNALYSSGSINKYIVVKPDASTGPFLGSFYTNSDLYGRFEDYIVTDLVNFIQSNYNADTSRAFRFVSGHSMGAYGAVKLALKHPDLFRAAAGHSGPLDFNNMSVQVPYVLAENGSNAPYNYQPENGIFTNIFFTMSGAFSPNLNNPPYYVDLPLDQNGTFIESIRSKWMVHNPSGLVKTTDPGIFPALYFDCGTLDELKLMTLNSGFSDTLYLMGLPYKYYSFNGYHSNKLNERLVYSFSFIDSVFNTRLTSSGEETEYLSDFTLFQNYPNPFNPSTVISFTITEQKHVSLIVYNVLGKEVSVLFDGVKSSGKYIYTFDAGGLAAGIYFCRLEAGRSGSVIKMVLMK